MGSQGFSKVLDQGAKADLLVEVGSLGSLPLFSSSVCFLVLRHERLFSVGPSAELPK